MASHSGMTDKQKISRLIAAIKKLSVYGDEMKLSRDRKIGMIIYFGFFGLIILYCFIALLFVS